MSSHTVGIPLRSWRAWVLGDVSTGRLAAAGSDGAEWDAAEPGELVWDQVVTRRWRRAEAYLMIDHLAWVEDQGVAVLVGTTPRLRIDEAWRRGPLIADLRVLARPASAPECWLLIPWYVLTTTGHHRPGV